MATKARWLWVCEKKIQQRSHERGLTPQDEKRKTLFCRSWFIPSSALKLTSQTNGPEAKTDTEPVFKGSVPCQSAGKKEEEQGGRTGLTAFPMMPHLQPCPADDLVYRRRLTGAGNQRQEGSGGRVSAAGGLRWAGQRGRALLQGSPRLRSGGGNRGGA